MGIQSTRDITREEAEARYIEKRKKEQEKYFKAEAVLLEKQELEDYIEETFDNYNIIN